jgi:uncharacterized protein YceK
MRKRLVFLALALSACGGIRYVTRTQTGGTIALQGDPEKAMEKAREAMAQHCNGAYTVTEEGEAVVGQTTSTAAAADTREHKDNRGASTYASGRTTTRNDTEWRVTYVCGYAPPPGGGVPPPPPPR